MIAWGPVQIEEGKTVAFRIGEVELYLGREGDEWLIANRKIAADEDGIASDSAAVCGLPEGVQWQRFIGPREDSLEVFPALPNRAVVVRPEAPVVILPGRHGQFYFTMPVWVRFLSTHQKGDQVVLEQPSKTLSNIWFGDPVGGELCYSLGDPLRRDYTDMIGQHGVVICPLHLTNASLERLKFERICVHVEHLNLYRSTDALWTNEVDVQFKGADQMSRISLSDKPPPNTTLLTERRVPSNRSLLAKSFSLLRQVTGM